MPGAKAPFDEAIDAARAAEAVVFVGGLTGDVEGEEMQVSYPGFAGGDRTDIVLPAPQERLLEAVQATGKPVVLVLMTGSALSFEWAKAHIPAIMVAWYPGQRGGSAVADALFGDANPAGRLPVTFYTSVSQLPPFADYDMHGRTYRYFSGEPLYPFGYGLSYTTFAYEDLHVDRAEAGASDPIRISLTVRNTGARPGDDVPQLYVRGPAAGGATALRSLRGFARVTAIAGATRHVEFVVTPSKDFSRYDETQKAFVVDPGSLRSGSRRLERRHQAQDGSAGSLTG